MTRRERLEIGLIVRQAIEEALDARFGPIPGTTDAPPPSVVQPVEPAEFARLRAMAREVIDFAAVRSRKRAPKARKLRGE